VGSLPSRGIIEKSGAWYSYKKQRLGQGREAAKAFLKEHAEVFDEIYEDLKKTLKTSDTPAKKDASSAAEAKAPELAEA